MKILTIVGTRPEIIRLAPTIARLDRSATHVLVHTGQNYDYELNEVFFRDLAVRAPDVFLAADTSTLGTTLGSVLVKTEEVLTTERPDGVVILGDTNSAIAALMARRMKIPVFHLEAGNRSFDENVPEEINRRMVDHVSDYNLVYTEHARRNLLAEGIAPSRIALIGSPLREVLVANETGIADSRILEREGLGRRKYVLASLHREENVDDPARLALALSALAAVGRAYGVPVLVSTHPRTRSRLESQPPELQEGLTFHAPFGFHDYIALQQNALVVLSDSGTVSEESAILGFPAVTMRDAIERPEAVEAGSIVTSGLGADAVLDAVRLVLGQFAEEGPPHGPPEYDITDTSRRVVNIIRSTVHAHHARSGIRRSSEP